LLPQAAHVPQTLSVLRSISPCSHVPRGPRAFSHGCCTRTRSSLPGTVTMPASSGVCTRGGSLGNCNGRPASVLRVARALAPALPHTCGGRRAGGQGVGYPLAHSHAPERGGRKFLRLLSLPESSIDSD
jgi:hypothetical protein